MSTTSKPLKYTWYASFEDGHLLTQPDDDKYSKHKDGADWNPSSFRDILDYEEKSRLQTFSIVSDGDYEIYMNLVTGEFAIDGNSFRLDKKGDTVKRKLIFFRDVEQNFVDGVAQEPEVVAYNIGYEYKENGKNVKRIITIDG